MKIFKNAKILIGSTIALATGVTFLIGCNTQSVVTTGHNVTYHAGTGFKINKVENFTAKNIEKISVEPTPDYSSGSKFVGWYTDQTFSTKVSFPLDVKKDINLFAKWESATDEAYTVSFDTDGGSEVPNYLIKKGNAVEVSPHTAKEGYTFLGWKDVKTPQSDYIIFPYSPTQNSSLKAYWKQTSFKATLHTVGSKPQGYENGSEDYTYVSPTLETAIQSCPVTISPNQSFTGWYEDESCTPEKLVTFPYELSENKKDLYAGFTEGGYTVTLSDNDNGEHSKTEKMVNTTYIPFAPAAIVTDDEKTFLGWSRTQGATEPEADLFPLQVDNNEITLYAVWIDRTPCTITFMDGDTVVKTEQKYEGQVYNDPPEIQDQKYKSFDGWFDQDLKTRIKFPHTITKDETFYTKTERKCFDVKIFDSESNNVIETPKTSPKIYQVPQTATVPGREDDYTLDTFYCVKKDGTTESIAKGIDFDSRDKNIENYLDDNNCLNLYATWKDRNYCVSVTYADGENAQVFKSNAQKQLTVGDLPTYTDKQTDSKIDYFEDTKTGKQYDVKNKTAKIDLGEVSLKAHWVSKTRKLNVYVGGQKDDNYTLNEITVENDVTTLSKIKTDKDSNYELIGYYKNEKPTEESKPEPLTTVIDSTWTAAYEAWKLKRANITINYYKDSTRQAKLGTKELKQYNKLTFNYREIASDAYTEYKDWNQIYIDDVLKFERSEEVFDPEIVLADRKCDYKIDICMKQTGFTVTYDPNNGGKSDNIVVSNLQNFIAYPAIPPSSGVDLAGWYDSDGRKYEHGETLDKDLTVKAKWVAESEQIQCTFYAGTDQLLATFADGSRTKEVGSYDGTIYSGNFPIATCEGNRFAGWFDASGKEYTNVDLTSSNNPGKLYAHWTPAAGSISICLKMDNEGYFKDTKSKCAIMTISSDKTWGQLKQFVPETEYENNEFIVGSWSTTSDGSNIIDDTYEFKSSQFIYAVKVDNKLTPTNFNTDNWATVNAVANNDKTHIVSGVENGVAALNSVYTNTTTKTTLIGETRSIKVGNLEYNARVIGLGQDYGDNNLSTKLPITFELDKLSFISTFNSDVNNYAWSTSELHSKLNTGGEFYTQFSDIITRNVATAYKVSKESSGGSEIKSACKMFIPSLYELNSGVSKYSTNQFKYTYYSEASGSTLSSRIMKEYSDLGKCNYFTRDYYSKNNNDWRLSYLKVVRNGSTFTYNTGDSTRSTDGRGVNIMFCLGTAY